jgi:hypothetical protein
VTRQLFREAEQRNLIAQWINDQLRLVASRRAGEWALFVGSDRARRTPRLTQ